MNREQGPGKRKQRDPRPNGEQGFMLLGLIVVIAIILIGLGAAAAEIAFSLRREREVESARRADQYVRAIRRFYLKTQHYPASVEQLENTNTIRFLRKRYVDPLTGKADYRLILVGQNKTTVKGFFGQPLGGLATTGLGSAAGMQSSGIAGPTTAGAGAAGAAGGVGGIGPAGAIGGAGIGGTVGGATGGTGTTGTTDSSGANSSLGSVAGMASSPGGGMPGSVGPFMGVGSSATGPSILVVNEQTTYQTWEFLYDPRIEKLKAAAALNSGASSVGAGALGTTPGGGFGSPTSGTGAAGPAGAVGPTSTGGTTGGSTAPTGTTPPTGP